MIFGKYINKFYKKYFWFFFFGIVFLIAVDVFQLFIPEIVGKLIDGVTDGSIFEPNSPIVNYIIQFVIIAFVMLIGRFAWRYFFFGAAVRVETDLRMDLFSYSLKLSTQFYKEHKQKRKYWQHCLAKSASGYSPKKCHYR